MERRSFLGLMGAVPFVGMGRFRKFPLVVSDWNDVVFEGTWVNAPGLATVQYKKDQCGFVRLKGTAFLEVVAEPDPNSEPLPPVGPTLFTLPMGFRPVEKMMIPCPMSNQLINLPMYINTDGTVNIDFGGGLSESVLVSLESITFEAV